jgi:hypothetical protein
MFRITVRLLRDAAGTTAGVRYPLPSGDCPALLPIPEGMLTGRRSEPRQRHAEALYTDQSWRPCTIMAWAAADAGWAALVRFADGTGGWYSHDRRYLRPAPPLGDAGAAAPPGS